jgi:hypothetical protein
LRSYQEILDDIAAGPRPYKLRAVMAEARQAFAAVYLPEVLEGEWAPSNSNWYGSRRGVVPGFWKHPNTFRRVGAKGPGSPRNSVLVSHSYMPFENLSPMHGRVQLVGLPEWERHGLPIFRVDLSLADRDWYWPGHAICVLIGLPELFRERAAGSDSLSDGKALASASR